MQNNIRLATVLFLALGFCFAQDNPAAVSHQEDGLHKAATLNGGKYVLIAPYTSYIQYNTLPQVRGESALVVHGRVLRNACRLNPHGNSVRTDYQVLVDTVLFGEPNETELTVSIPGGMVRFDDGSTALHTVPNYRRMTNGTTVLLFLRRGERNAYVPATGPSSIFEISDGVVHPYAPRGSELAPKYNDAPEPAFLNELSVVIQDYRKEKAN